jgi:hypothetical protein
MPKKIILAVAVGSIAERVLDSQSPNLDKLRPYVAGLIDWLENQTTPPKAPTGSGTLPRFVCGTAYKIIYRERSVLNLPNAFQDLGTLQPDLIFCMSTSVAKAAQIATTTLPIVAIVSEPDQEGLNANVCGVSAKRDFSVVRQLQEFKRLRPGLGTIYALHRTGYAPSDRALGYLNNVTPVPVPDNGDIEAIIRAIPATANRGILVLPADRFFGVAEGITVWTGTSPTFWPTPDFPMASFGGFGYEQKLCGKFMAQVVATIWHTGAIPTPPHKFIVIPPGHQISRP